MHYVTRLSHFKFRADGDSLHVTSERDDDFSVEYDWPDEWSVTDEDLVTKIHEKYYTNLQNEFRE